MTLAGSMKRLLGFLLIVVCFLIISSCSKTDDLPVEPEKPQIRVGALLSLTGGWSSLGNASRAALNLTVIEINHYLLEIGSPYEVFVQYEDTKLDTTLALQRLKSMAETGIKCFIGPQSSAEVAAVKKYADENNLLIISQGSTAGNLAIAGDNIFRFCPSDSLEGDAIAKLMWHEGIRSYIPLSRNDAGNLGLQKSAKQSFTKLGGNVTSGIIFEQNAVNFALQTISNEVIQQKLLYGSDKVAVYLTVFDQVLKIFNDAAKDPELASVKWYGSDGVVLDNKMITDTVVASFAAQTYFPCPTYGLSEENRFRWEPLSAQVKAMTGSEPDAFALAVYDALWVVTLAHINTNMTTDFTKLKKAFVQSANTYYGLTGTTTLNSAGDRKFGYYDYWGIRKENNNFKWMLIGHSD